MRQTRAWRRAGAAARAQGRRGPLVGGLAVGRFRAALDVPVEGLCERGEAKMMG
jgi:hypothetical protein